MLIDCIVIHICRTECSIDIHHFLFSPIFILLYRYLDRIEQALVCGEVVLIENVEERLDAILEPLLARNTTNKGRQEMHRLRFYLYSLYITCNKNISSVFQQSVCIFHMKMFTWIFFAKDFLHVILRRQFFLGLLLAPKSQ